MTDTLTRAISLICAAAKERDRTLVALDGRCASGKTTLAAALENALGCTVLHMDDFFLRPEQRTSERLAVPGENIDHERFLAEILLPLRKGRTIAYRRFDCRTQTILPPLEIHPSPVILVEGSYACHPALRMYYDLRLFLTVDPAEQMARILARNGEASAAVFRDRWIPLEEAYFAGCAVETCCVRLSGSS